MNKVPRDSEQFQLVNLEDVPAVMKEISAAEENLNGLVNGKVALVAYVLEGNTPHKS